MINKLKAFISNFRAEWEYRRAVKHTIAELSALTNAELNDIGISRGEIYSIAHHSHTKPAKVKADDYGVVANDNMKGFV